MSLDRSLKSHTGLSGSRNVLSRTERLAILKDEERWDEGMSVFGLPKVKQKKSKLGGKSKSAATETSEETPADANPEEAKNKDSEK